LGGREGFRHLPNGGSGRLKDAVETTQHDERQDDLAIPGLLEVAAKTFGDGPDERAERFDVCAHVDVCGGCLWMSGIEVEGDGWRGGGVLAVGRRPSGLVVTRRFETEPAHDVGTEKQEHRGKGHRDNSPEKRSLGPHKAGLVPAKIGDRRDRTGGAGGALREGKHERLRLVGNQGIQ